jgi:hypothetical protein
VLKVRTVLVGGKTDSKFRRRSKMRMGCAVVIHNVQFVGDAWRLFAISELAGEQGRARPSGGHIGELAGD